jgi:AraC family transcriptional regulator of adaptative response/methylated-DNA-[protein]-cysteine methyltransferase
MRRSAPDEIRFGLGHTSVGSILVAQGDQGLVAIIIQERPGMKQLVAQLAERFPRARLIRDEAACRAEVAAVVDFVEDPHANLSLPLDIRATEFQRRVYEEVLTIPFGETTTFSAIAARIRSPKATRAVGNACTRNPLEFAIPCHRVLRADGAWSGGGAWGDRRQATIVTRERAARR